MIAAADAESTAAAVAIVLGAVGLLAGQMAAVVVSLRNRTSLKGVAKAVDGHSEQMTARIAQLTAALEGSDTNVPEPTRRTG